MLICGVIYIGRSEKTILDVIWILDFKSWILDFNSWILDFGFQILDFGSASDQVLVVRRWTR